MPLSRISLGAKPDTDRSNGHTAVLTFEVVVLLYTRGLDLYLSATCSNHSLFTINVCAHDGRTAKRTEDALVDRAFAL